MFKEVQFGRGFCGQNNLSSSLHRKYPGPVSACQCNGEDPESLFALTNLEKQQSFGTFWDVQGKARFSSCFKHE